MNILKVFSLYQILFIFEGINFCLYSVHKKWLYYYFSKYIMDQINSNKWIKNIESISMSITQLEETNIVICRGQSSNLGHPTYSS